MAGSAAFWTNSASCKIEDRDIAACRTRAGARAIDKGGDGPPLRRGDREAVGE